MATMEQKKLRQLRLYNDIIFGFGKGLWDLFGDSAMATADAIGEDILEEMEHELGLEIQGENAEDILTEIERLLVDEYGLVKNASLYQGSFDLLASPAGLALLALWTT